MRGLEHFLSVVVALFLIFATTIHMTCRLDNTLSYKSAVFWSLIQWIPSSSISNYYQEQIWEEWGKTQNKTEISPILSIQTVDVQQHTKSNVLDYLESTYGNDWRDRPVLFKNLWTPEELQNPDRRLSLQGMLSEPLEIPYFQDARQRGALSPDGRASIGKIVANITEGHPHKIGTQFLIQEYPELLHEVAPMELVTALFGDHFQPNHLAGQRYLIPGTLTVPLFVASGNMNQNNDSIGNSTINDEDEACQSNNDKAISALVQRPMTGLHCEPIGNVAVQLSGSKQWTLVHPKYSMQLQPSISPDGRAFFASWSPSLEHVPRYTTVTSAGGKFMLFWTWRVHSN